MCLCVYVLLDISTSSSTEPGKVLGILIVYYCFFYKSPSLDQTVIERLLRFQ